MCCTSPMELLPIYRSAVRQFDARVRAVGDTQWASKTPDTEWDVRDLVAHVIDGQRAVVGVIDGALAARQGQEVDAADLNPTVGAAGAGATTGGPEEVGDDPVGAWEQASGAAVQALSRPGALDGEVPDGGGVITAVQYGWQAATELTVHAWDVARATNGVDEFPNDLIGEVLQHAKSSYGQWYDSERYAPCIPVPGCTDDLIELLALTGRNRWWRPA
jgi:uncharacterized protein (TIGR03086 family)